AARMAGAIGRADVASPARIAQEGVAMADRIARRRFLHLAALGAAATAVVACGPTAAPTPPPAAPPPTAAPSAKPTSPPVPAATAAPQPTIGLSQAAPTAAPTTPPGAA